MSQRPVAIGLQLCEQIIVDEETRNVTLVSCFNKRFVERIPSEPLSFAVFAVLTDGSGEMSVTVQLERLDTFDPVLAVQTMVRFESPLQEFRCRFRVRRCSFPIAGSYQVVLLADNEVIAQRKLEVILLEEDNDE